MPRRPPHAPGASGVEQRLPGFLATQVGKDMSTAPRITESMREDARVISKACSKP